MVDKPIRLQVFLSRNGVCSRRKALDLVKSGVVSVNGDIICEPSFSIVPGKDIVAVNGKYVKPVNYEYVLLNKPAGYVTTKADRFAKKTVFDLLPRHLHVLNPVGRLDRDTEGLLFLTNDGELAFSLTHPKFNIERQYFVKIIGDFSNRDKKLLENGIIIDSGKTLPARIRYLCNKRGIRQLFITIYEGKKRQIRRMFERIGCKVIYLKRLSHGPLMLGNLRLGEWRHLEEKEVDMLKNYIAQFNLVK